MRILNWNIEWASPTSSRGRRIKEIVASTNPDLICFTEATAPMLPESGYSIESDADYGYTGTAGRRKVILWSSEPWCEVDLGGNGAFPGGRFVCGVTHGIRFVGVCIPWRDAHVRTGRKDRAAWEDHLVYLDALSESLGNMGSDTPVCVLGDYNQRIPRTRQPQEVADALDATLDRVPGDLMSKVGERLANPRVAPSRVLLPQIIDRVFLLAVQPTRRGKGEELECLGHPASLADVPRLEKAWFHGPGRRRPIYCIIRGRLFSHELIEVFFKVGVTVRVFVIRTIINQWVQAKGSLPFVGHAIIIRIQ